MNQREFADKHGLKCRPGLRHYLPGPHPDRQHVPGKRGWITGDKGHLMKVFACGHRLLKWIREGRRLGMEPQGRGDTEVMMWFDSRDQEQVKFAIKMCGARKRRKVALTPEQRRALVERLRKVPRFCQAIA
jgi:hypothetical protein